jgi:hypothetical protein
MENYFIKKMKITEIIYYNGARDKICRLGLSSLFLEVQQIILETKISVLKEKWKNSAAVIRENLDEAFTKIGGWKKSAVGDVDWEKTLRYNESVISRIGVEVQVSARSDLVIRDLVHLKNNLHDGKIDAGVIIVPSDVFAYYLTNRCPNLRETKKVIEKDFPEAMTYPIIIMAIENDEFSDVALPKKKTKTGK